MKGLRILPYVDAIAEKLAPKELSRATYSLCVGSDPYAALESPEKRILDNSLLGDELDVLDAVTMVYGRSDSKMKALQRALNSAMKRSDSGITVEDMEVGKPRKSGLTASVSVRFSFSDGQTVTVIFHAPDGDPTKVDADDILISYRWMLNGRDVTAWMSPEKDDDKLVDISLATLGMRVSQLIEANTAKFTERQTTLAADKKALEDAKEAGLNAANKIADLEQAKESSAAEVAEIEKLANDAQKKIDIALKRHSDLTSKLDSLQAAQAGDDTEEKEDFFTGGLKKIVALAKKLAPLVTLQQLHALMVAHTYKAAYRKSEGSKNSVKLADYELAVAKLNKGAYLSRGGLTKKGKELMSALQEESGTTAGFGRFMKEMSALASKESADNFEPNFTDSKEIAEKFLNSLRIQDKIHNDIGKIFADEWSKNGDFHDQGDASKLIAQYLFENKIDAMGGQLVFIMGEANYFGMIESGRETDQFIEEIEVAVSTLKAEENQDNANGGIGAMGSKLDLYESMDFKDVVKLIRAEIKRTFPAIKSSAKLSRYSGGKSLNVEITSIPDGMSLYSDEFLEHQQDNPNSGFFGESRYAPEAKEVIETITQIGDQYRYDESDSQSDYFNTNFYNSVKFSSDLTNTRMTKEMAEYEEAEEPEIVEPEIVEPEVEEDESEELIGNIEFDKRVLANFFKDWNAISGDSEWKILRAAAQSDMMTIYSIDAGIDQGSTRSLFVQSLVGKIKRSHKNGFYDAVDNVLDMIADYNRIALKPFVRQANAIWKLRSAKEDNSESWIDELINADNLNQDEKYQLLADSLEEADTVESTGKAWDKLLTELVSSY